jgi:hypothetical protein
MAMTGLPFVYAAWTGRAGAIGPDQVRWLQEAQAEGVRDTEAIAAEYGRGDAARTARAAVYLRDNVKYGLGPDEAAGLQLFRRTLRPGVHPVDSVVDPVSMADRAADGMPVAFATSARRSTLSKASGPYKRKPVAGALARTAAW